MGVDSDPPQGPVVHIHLNFGLINPDEIEGARCPEDEIPPAPMVISSWAV